jgi:hypothetical protein
MYWQYTTASAGAGLRVTPAKPNRTLTAKPADVTDLIERRFCCMVIPPDRTEERVKAALAATPVRLGPIRT